MRHKYNAIRTEVNGIKFPSKRESRYYQDLLLAQKSGELLFFLRQIPFDLIGGVRYVCDFMEFWRNGEIRFTDCKGFSTDIYKLKKKQVETLYPIKIIEV